MEILKTTRRGSALILTMNRPEARNALSIALVHALHEGVTAAGGQRDVRAVIITGAGDKAFSAGIDLKERATLSPEGKAIQSRSLLTLGEAISASPKPVIAAVGGWCLGGGSELALACDLRIAADDARFGFPEMTLGAYPGSGGPVTLSRLVGAARARDILFTARTLDAVQAEQLGLVQRVVPRDALLEQALAWAGEMEVTSPLALAALKRSINTGMSMSQHDALEFDQALRRPLDLTRDYAEGMRAHFEKRKPVFTGE
ncbi:enoyl-CoA hydratase [Burkholderia sp. WAC0059]|uniref:enoyl-CoA hydratase/isomerase family protein n=1 Tax=Burkholderia sp. WAC0059 TaxID=2066022 RepID=UPI000C7F6327|nr:enoyl-CoA hydratase-related protein [Burkholderia sp. WAC0059]PLZ02664.1 enoyl-CoA hydratase [Burkholderia sp. WAC0059]